MPSRIIDPGSVRPDGSRKDTGFLGPLKLRGGGVATEYSIPMWEKGVPGQPGYERGRDIPTLVPTLSKKEIEMMVNDIIPNRKPIPRSIAEKARKHAADRILQGKSPFFSSESDKR